MISHGPIIQPMCEPETAHRARPTHGGFLSHREAARVRVHGAFGRRRSAVESG
jgi:hypothetical protein